jgi:hypothetical protein
MYILTSEGVKYVNLKKRSNFFIERPILSYPRQRKRREMGEGDAKIHK